MMTFNSIFYYINTSSSSILSISCKFYGYSYGFLNLSIYL